MVVDNADTRMLVQWETEAESGDVEAYDWLSLFYFKKSKTPQDEDMKKGIFWAQKKELAGYRLNALQAYFMAMDIINDPNREDKTHAIELLEYAAEQHMANAVFQLACCYSIGRGVSQDYSKAVELFQKACDMDPSLAKLIMKKAKAERTENES